MDHLDHRILSALRVYGGDPRVAGAARALSWAGEHGALWLAAGLAGAAADGARRGAWLRGTALTAGAHLASMGVKRVVRRPRPAHVAPLVRTAGRHSFPSSHAASAAAAAVAFGMLTARGSTAPSLAATAAAPARRAAAPARKAVAPARQAADTALRATDTASTAPHPALTATSPALTPASPVGTAARSADTAPHLALTAKRLPPTEPHPALTTARPADTAHPVGTATRPADTTPRPADTTPHPTPHPTLTVARVVLPPLAAAVCLSRLVVGVHYPSDVVAGAALGVLTACAGARWMKGGAHD